MPKTFTEKEKRNYPKVLLSKVVGNFLAIMA